MGRGPYDTRANQAIDITQGAELFARFQVAEQLRSCVANPAHRVSPLLRVAHLAFGVLAVKRPDRLDFDIASARRDGEKEHPKPPVTGHVGRAT